MIFGFNVALAFHVRHDLKAFENWKVRCRDRDSAVYHAELQHKVQRQMDAQKQAQTLFELSSPNWIASLEVLGGAQEAMHRIKATMSKLQGTFQVRSDEIYVLVVCNWSSPSLVSSASQKSQATVLGALCNDSTSRGRILGCVLEPCHTYNKGQLWKQEEMLHKMLVNARCNIDGRFVLPFAERQDDRDQRLGLQILTPLPCMSSISIFESVSVGPTTSCQCPNASV